MELGAHADPAPGPHRGRRAPAPAGRAEALRAAPQAARVPHHARRSSRPAARVRPGARARGASPLGGAARFRRRGTPPPDQRRGAHVPPDASPPRRPARLPRARRGPGRSGACCATLERGVVLEDGPGASIGRGGFGGGARRSLARAHPVRGPISGGQAALPRGRPRRAAPRGGWPSGRSSWASCPLGSGESSRRPR